MLSQSLHCLIARIGALGTNDIFVLLSCVNTSLQVYEFVGCRCKSNTPKKHHLGISFSYFEYIVF